VRVIARTWSQLRLDWEMGLHRLPFFTQKVAVMLLGTLVATLALLGGVASLVGPPGADGPDHLVPGSTGGSPPVTTRLAPGQAGGQGAAAGGATAPAPAGDPAQVPAGAPASGHAPAGPKAPARAGGGTPAAPPTTTAPTTTTGQGGLPPLGGVVSSVVPTLLP
jgi:hypothetical protein